MAKRKSALWLLVVALLIIVPLLVACAGKPAPVPTPTPPPSPSPPPTPPAPTAKAIPHTLEGRADCLLCHGPTGVKAFPANHAGRTNDACTTCHKPKA